MSPTSMWDQKTRTPQIASSVLPPLVHFCDVLEIGDVVSGNGGYILGLVHTT